MSVLVAGLDQLIAAEDTSDGKEFPAAHGLSLVLAWLHFPVLVAGVTALSGQTGLSGSTQVILFIALGLFFGQVSNSNAHELIHSTSRSARRLGMWVYISLLYGHHTSAHVHVHHIHVASQEDPATASKGISFYRYALRAWIGGFKRGWHVEQARASKARTRKLNPYWVYVTGAVSISLMAFLIGGLGGLAAFALLAAYAQLQLLMSDYVQHYGLTRRRLPSGKLEPVGARHSWNAPHVMSSALMLNAPRHSDHHANPSRGYAELRLETDMPMLPYSLPVMAVLALWPARWRRVMDPRVAHWTKTADPAPALDQGLPDAA
ncbi:alkane 1-monooxygenase [Pseudaestuariivita sp.]|uniref:alkane 1-monooxygenase n=1 Tax=Pseudaestuariivita sp. TaxID=2211669 RepID=UPI004058E7E6